jgi:transcriptional regulator with XRE-family HTH domain
MNAFDKIFVARVALSLKQKEAAELSGVKQSVVSVMERGEKNFIPTNYLSFLCKKGIDLNWIFNDADNRTADIFRNPAGDIINADKAVSNITAYDDERIQLILPMNRDMLNSFAEEIVSRYKSDFKDEFDKIVNDLKNNNMNPVSS